jgi:hypothetical protein
MGDTQQLLIDGGLALPDTGLGQGARDQFARFLALRTENSGQPLVDGQREEEARNRIEGRQVVS